MSTHQYRGVVVDKATQAGLPGLRVEGWDIRRVIANPVVAADTDADGGFTLQISDDALTDLFGKDAAVLIFRVVDHGNVKAVSSTAPWGARNDAAGKIEVAGGSARVVGTLAKPSNYTVEGYVFDPESGPVSGAAVKVTDRDIAVSAGVPSVISHDLTTVTTDARGHFLAVYNAAALGAGPSGKAVPDILVSAKDREGNDLATQNLGRARPRMSVRLVKGGDPYPGPSNFHTLSDRIASLPGMSTSTFQYLNGDLAQHVANRTAHTLDHVEAFGKAAIMAAAHTAVGHEVFFGLIKAGFPDNEDELFCFRLPAMKRGLLKAVDAGHVSAAVKTNIDTAMTNLEAAAVTVLSATAMDELRIGELLNFDTSGTAPSLDAKSRLMKYLLNSEGTAEDVWSALATDVTHGDFTATDVAKMRFAVEAAPLAAGHAPLIQHLIDRQTAGDFTDAGDLANLDKSGWLAAIAAAGNTVPPDTPGMDLGAQINNYAQLLLDNVGFRFRTAAIAKANSGLAFFGANPTFDFLQQRVAATTYSGSDLPQVKDLERQAKLTTNVDQMTVLQGAGFKSAASIHAAGLLNFKNKTGFDIDIAKFIFNSACWVSSGALKISSLYSPKLEKVLLAATPDRTASATPPPLVPDWATLFGSPDSCACDECLSVHGPAAYFVDLLDFLKSQPTGNIATPTLNLLDVLLASRPDLSRLLLTCENADTALPYVDLVLEILEVRAFIDNTSPLAWPSTPASVDTNRTTDELLAQPEVQYPTEYVGCYRALASTVYPFSSPFHLWQEEARIYLDYLGVHRQDLLLALTASPDATALSYVALERLGMSLKEHDLIAGSLTGAIASFWGYTNSDGDHSWLNADSGTPHAHLGWVSVFMQRAGITYEQVLELMSTQHVAVDLGLAISPADKCDVSILTIDWGSTTDKAHFVGRILRLLRRFDWSITGLAKAVQAFGPALDATVLANLASMKVVVERLAVDPLVALSFWYGMDVYESWPNSPSLFRQTYLNARVSNPPDSDLLTIFGGGTPSPAVTVADKRGILLGALQLSDKELRLLTDSSSSNIDIGLAAEFTDTTVLDLSVLSRLYRIAAFARALKMPVADYLALHALANLTPLAGDSGGSASPEATISFLKLVDKLAGAKASIEEIDYVVRDFGRPASSIVPTADVVTSWRTDLEVGVATATSEADGVIDSTGERTKTLLLNLLPVPTPPALPESVVDPIVAFLNDSTTDHATGSPQFALISPFMEDPAAAEIALLWPATGDPTNAYLTTALDRFTYVARRLVRRVETTSFVQQSISTTFSLDQASATHLLTSGALTWSSQVALFAFIPGSAPPDPAAPANVREQLLVRIYKASLLIKRFKLTVAEVQRLFRAAPGTDSTLPWLNLDDLPALGSTPDTLIHAQPRFAVWLRFVDYSALRDNWPGDVDSLFAVFDLAAAASSGSSPTSDLLNAISMGAGWGRDDLDKLVAHMSIHANDLADERTLTTFLEIFRLLNRLGASAGQAISWVDLSVDPALPYKLPVNLTDVGPNSFTVARDIKTVARAKHSDAEWADIAKPLRDVLREKQRATLVDYLLVKLQMADANALYEELLLDVQMSPASLTSRLVLAHSSCQQFVEEILLHLRGDNALTADAARDWQWMKYFRVWEANRKVFLYPENWITPELRSDKTPLFVDLESTLLQGPLTNDAIEDAYRTYLDGLADLASLEVISLHVEEPQSSLNFIQPAARTVHVFARSLAPKRYFHRTREQGLWTPWTLLDLDIDTDHILPITLDGHLYLFWPSLDEVAAAQDPLAQPPQEPSTTTSIRLSFAFQSNGKWIGRGHASSLPVKLNSLYAPQDLSFVFRGVDGDGLLTIECVTAKLLAPDLSGASAVAVFVFDPGDRTIDGGLPKVLTINLAMVEDVIEPPPVLIHKPVFSPITLNTAALVQYFGSFTAPATKMQLGFNALEDAIRSGAIGPAVTVIPWFQGYKHNHPLNVYATAPSDSLNLWMQTDDQKYGPRQVFAGPLNEFDLLVNRVDGVQQQPFVFLKDQKRSGLKRTLFLSLETVRHITTSPMPNNCVRRSFLFPVTHTHYRKAYQVELFYHPYVTTFRRELALHGLDGLLRWADQSPTLQLQSNDITGLYVPNADTVITPMPKEQVDFTTGSPFGIYNWELFFHAPFMIASRLTQEGRYEDAQRWYQYIFDPTDGTTKSTAADGPTHFWKVKPLFQNKNLAQIQAELGGDSPYSNQINAWSNPANVNAQLQLSKEIASWTNNPFDPDVIARLRPVAYQKLIVMSYIQNLIGWGDSLFLQDSIESINEATQLYVIAQGLLGPRPIFSSPPTKSAPKTYADLEAASEALEDAESLVPPLLPIDQDQVYDVFCGARPSSPYNIFRADDFCVPPNPQLTGLWDTVGDRLFKIRHSMNIDGVVRSLPLFQPPIDPALLIRARAAGVDISSVLSDLNVAAPPYRYSVLFAKATEFVGALTSLGYGLLSAMEKRDAESLANLRAGHDVANQKAQLDIRKQELTEAQENVKALELSQNVVQKRFEFYSTIVENTPKEKQAFKAADAAAALTNSAGLAHASAAIAYAIPNFVTGASGFAASPVATVTVGGEMFGKVAEAFGAVYNLQAARRTHDSTKATTLASWERRADDWALQAELAKRELAQFDSQIIAAQIRVELAQKQVDLTEQQMEQAEDVETFLRDKFTNQELYTWMVGQTSAIYFQSYKLAYEMAKRAEKAFQYERGDVTQTFIQFGAWDGVRQGILAGERLGLDLRRLDAAYLAQNTRELELTKDVSLLNHDPEQLLTLRETGIAELTINEAEYDRDYAFSKDGSSHYLRRLKTVAATLQCVTGAYQGVRGRLTLLQGATRPTALDPTPADSLPQTRGAIQQVAISQAQGDTGLFELNFKDERLLPFEGVGAQAETGAQWRFELSGGNEFDYASIDDFILRVRYTARPGRRVTPVSATRQLMLRLRSEFADAWEKYQTDLSSKLVLAVPEARFTRSFGESGHPWGAISQLRVYVKWFASPTPPTLAMRFSAPLGSEVPMAGGPPVTNLVTFADTADIASTKPDSSGNWVLNPVTGTTTPLTLVQRAGLEDIWIILDYKGA